uniref:Cadherin-related family member 4 n=1 Tax=Malurus cyaneus samueli TaxID=2593467 RepID=A0A8C5ULB3_9PASS
PTGEIRVVGPLGSQQQKSYRLLVRLTDTHNDLDLSRRQRSIEPPMYSLTPLPPQTLQKEPLVVTRTEAVWQPPAWFVAVLTISGVLLLATLGCTARNLLAWWNWGCSDHAREKSRAHALQVALAAGRPGAAALPAQHPPSTGVVYTSTWEKQWMW